MAASMIPVVAHQQWRLLVRDRRLAILGCALLIVLLTVLATGAAGTVAREAERAVAQAEEARVWALQGDANPHGAAHFGRYIYKPRSPLAELDPGLLPQLGSALRLEAHAQNPASIRAIDGGVALDRFSGLTPATMLQVLAPLLVILAGFAAFAGDGSRALLKQELASGTAPSVLLAGRLIGLAGMILLLIAVVFATGLVAVLVSGGAASDVAALMLMSAGYALYLLIFAALTLAASAALPSARTALVALLTFWAVATLFVPRIAPAIAESLRPTLSGPAFEAAVTEEVRKGPSGHDPMDARLERLKAATLKHYRVNKVEDLPVDFGGISLLHGEALSTSIYRRYFNALYGGYAAQARIARAFAAISPMMAMKPLSAALARSDQAAHRRLLEEADRYRFDLVQRLNRDIIRNRKTLDTPYMANVAAITQHARFTPRPEPLSTVVLRQLPDLAILATWALFATLLALAASRRLRRAGE
jgi:ABC-2 type transport system permease protein